MKVHIVTVIVLSLLETAWSHAQVRAQPSFRHENTSENLAALMKTIVRQIQDEKSLPDGARLFRSLIPDESRLKSAFKDGVPPAVIERVSELYRTITRTWDARSLARPEQTVVKVRGATTEEIRAYKKGSIAFNSFPGGTKTVAEQLLRPGVTFYEVEFLEPGEDDGMQYHLFYWDGRQWSMLGPIWRVLESPAQSVAAAQAAPVQQPAPTTLQMAWTLGSRLSLAAVLHERGGAAELVNKQFADASAAGRALGVDVPPLPSKSGEKARDGAVILHYVVRGASQPIADVLSEKYTATHTRLYELAAKSNLLLILYAPGDSTAMAFLNVIERNGPACKLPDALWKPVVDLVRAEGTFHDV